MAASLILVSDILDEGTVELSRWMADASDRPETSTGPEIVDGKNDSHARQLLQDADREFRISCIAVLGDFPAQVGSDREAETGESFLTPPRGASWRNCWRRD